MAETYITVQLEGIRYSFLVCYAEEATKVSEVFIGAARIAGETRLAQVEKLAKELYPQHNFIFS